MAHSSRMIFLWIAVLIIILPSVHAFGAGNIASVSAVEGKNWRHGDIEDMLKMVACIKHHKWTSMMIKRVYFGNWLRDYSQAMDTAALKKAQPETIRVLVWLLSFLGFGYATAEFEVTSERLGVYRPEEHIDNPKDYNDNEDARSFDPRLRGPVRPVELQIDPETGMKNYIANGNGDWATSAAFVKYTFERSIHHGRLYTNGSGFFKGKDEDLAEALRLLGQGLHTLEDFGAHSNYVELALREQGFHNVFTHTGTATEINLHGKRVFPLVTGTFGTVDFYHSVLGEATDHFTQSEVNEMDNALGIAQTAAQSSSPLTTLVKLLAKVPGTRELCAEAEQLQRSADVQAREMARGDFGGGQAGLRGIFDLHSDDNSRDGGDYPGAQYHGSDEHTRVPQPDWSGPQVVYPQDQGGAGSQPPPPAYGQPQWNDQQHPQSFNMAETAAYPAPPPQWQDQQPPQHEGPQLNQQPSQYPPEQPAWSQQQQVSVPGQQQANPEINPQPTPSQPQQAPLSAPAGLPGLPNFDAAQTIQQIYPILAFRDKVVRTISAIIEKIPGLEQLVERITETLTVFVLSLLAPFVRPVIKGISTALKAGSSTVVDASGKHQYEPWTDSNCSDPTHSLLSKDHFSNILNPPAGAVAAEILKFIAPRVLYAWQHPDVPIQQVMGDVERVFHHPAIRDGSSELHRSMFGAVEKWVQGRADRGSGLNDILSSESVRNGKNQIGNNDHTGHTHNPVPGFHTGLPGVGSVFGGSQHHQSQSGLGGLISSFTGSGQHQQHNGSGMNEYLNLAAKLPIPGVQNVANKINKFSHFIPGGFGGNSRAIEEFGSSEVGGRRELLEAEQTAERGEQGISRGPSPMPPTGYESYAGHAGGNEYQPSSGPLQTYGYQDQQEGSARGDYR